MIETFQPKLKEDPDAHLARVALAEAYADLGRWEEARTLLSGVADHPRLRVALAAICTREFDAQLTAISEAGDAQAAPPAGDEPDESADAAAEPGPDFALLRTALRSVPDYGPALARLERELYRESSAGRDTVQRLLLEMLADGEQPAALHRLLGLRATWLEDWPIAASHFEQACRQRPDDAFLRNNLAYALLKAEQTSNQLRRAALLATEALQLAPGHPEILATRGEIRVRLKQYDAATTDLETALKSLPRRAELHRLLAECYDELGPTSLAEMHREKAKQVDSQSQGR
jgi:Flp pilus assembly protein TadD